MGDGENPRPIAAQAESESAPSGQLRIPLTDAQLAVLSVLEDKFNALRKERSEAEELFLRAQEAFRYADTASNAMRAAFVEEASKILAGTNPPAGSRVTGLDRHNAWLEVTTPELGGSARPIISNP